MGKEVKPIKDLSKIDELKRLLLKQGLYQEFLIFALGLNTGLRVGDILLLKWGDLNKQTICIKEQKTGKTKEFKLNTVAVNAIGVVKAFRKTQGLPEPDPETFVFESARKPGKPLTRQYVWATLNYYAEQIGLKGIGTHSMRKTFGYHAYQRGVDITLLCRVFNHSAPSVTLRYIGIEKENIDDVYDLVTL